MKSCWPKNVKGLDGLKYISKPRTSTRRSGLARVLSLEQYASMKLLVISPEKVEVLFGLMRPKNKRYSLHPRDGSKIILTFPRFARRFVPDCDKYACTSF